MDASNKLITKAEARKITCVSRTQQWRLENQGLYPKSRKIPGSNKVVYVYEEIIHWLQSLPIAQCTPGDAETEE